MIPTLVSSASFLIVMLDSTKGAASVQKALTTLDAAVVIVGGSLQTGRSLVVLCLLVSPRGCWWGCGGGV